MKNDDVSDFENKFEKNKFHIEISITFARFFMGDHIFVN